MDYYFYQAGSIPGVPGIFAGVIVTVDPTTNTVTNVRPIQGDDTQPPPPQNPPDNPPPPFTGA